MLETIRMIPRAAERSSIIPREHLLAHDFCLRLRDQIARLIDQGFEQDLFKLNVRLTEPEHQEWKEKQFHPWEWLEKYGRSKELGELLIKSLFPALASDFCQFIEQALLSSERGLLAVTFALLRKPLQESLLFLEWLLADPEEFLNVFYNDQSRDLGTKSGSGYRNADRRRLIIKGALKRLPNAPFYGADWQNEIRFDLGCPYGLAGLCHKAIHLVTNAPEIATEQRNLNFIFIQDEDLRQQWSLLYSVLPFVLYHAATICETLMALATGVVPRDHPVFILERTLGLILFSDNLQGISSETFKPLEIVCPSCQAIGYLDRAQTAELLRDGSTYCVACRSHLTLARLAFHSAAE